MVIMKIKTLLLLLLSAWRLGSKHHTRTSLRRETRGRRGRREGRLLSVSDIFLASAVERGPSSQMRKVRKQIRVMG